MQVFLNPAVPPTFATVGTRGPRGGGGPGAAAGPLLETFLDDFRGAVAGGMLCLYIYTHVYVYIHTYMHLKFAKTRVTGLSPFCGLAAPLCALKTTLRQYFRFVHA